MAPNATDSPIRPCGLVAIPMVLAALLWLPTHATAQTSGVEDWVGCWILDHEEDWGPSIDQPGFPTGSQAPGPRRILLDRLPAQRSSLDAAPGATTYRAEWADAGLRTRESWALRADDQVFVEAVRGAETQSLLMEGPPVAQTIPGRWFLRRSDTPYPEVRSLIVPQRVPCGPGQGPHTVERRPELDEIFARHGVEGTFVVYDLERRRIVHPATAMSDGLAVEEGPRVSAEDQMVWLVDRLQERTVRSNPVPAWIDPDAVLDTRPFADREGLDAVGVIEVAALQGSDGYGGWILLQLRAEGVLHHVASISVRGISDEDEGFVVLEAVALELLHELEVVPENRPSP